MRIKQNLFFLLFSALLVMGVGCKKVCEKKLRCGFFIYPSSKQAGCFNLYEYSDFESIPNMPDSITFQQVFDTVITINSNNKILTDYLEKSHYECD